MQIERPFGDNNQAILCNVPPMLPGELFNQAIELKMSSGVEQRFGDFSISAFISRYLAGNSSLREARLVSRKRLALVASEVGYLDAQAVQLHQQIQRYQQAKQILIDSPVHTLDAICKLNGLIAPEQKGSGKLRQRQNWVGGKTPFIARYVCPPPEAVAALMDNWLTFINATSYSPEAIAITGHCSLASIHPFSEGNGRTARLFLDGMLEKTHGDKVPLLTYRLSPACSGYIEAQELMNIGDPQSLSHPFWREAIAWSDQLQITFVDILSACKKQLHSKIGMNRLSAASAKLLNRLWSQPIVCQRGLLTLFDMDINAVRLALNELVKMGILDSRKLRSPENAVIYDCPIIFAAYTAMDDAIFVNV